MEQQKLTPEQEKELVVFRDYWLAVGLKTGPVDRDKTISAIHETYRERGHEPPPEYYWARSPLEGCALATLLQNDKAHAALKKANKDLTNLFDTITYRPDDTFAGWKERFTALAKELGVKGSDKILSGKNLREQLNNACYGQYDVYWLAFWAFVKKLGGEGEADPWPMLRLAENCGWWFPYKEAVVLCERPNTLFRDGAGRLHNTSAMAVEFSDGWGVAAVHGVRVPATWVTQPLDPKTALTWNNIEQRRAAAEIVGWAKVLEHVEAKVVDQDKDPSIGTLYEADVPDSEGSRFLKVLCGTGRTFVLSVPATCKTALEANAWTYGLEADQLDLDFRT